VTILPRVALLLSALAASAAGGGCELVIDPDPTDEPDAGLPDATPGIDTGGGFPDAAASCQLDLRYESVPGIGNVYRLVAPDRFDIGRVRCQADGAELASIGSSNEEIALAAYIAAELPSRVNCPTGRCAFVGLSQSVSATPENGWTWADGTVEPLNWAASQPDDVDGIEDEEEDCGVLDESGLFDAPCNIDQFAVCECPFP